MIKQTDSNVPAGEYLCLYYDTNDIVDLYFCGSLDALTDYPVKNINYGLYHETHCPDSTVINRFFTAVYHDICKCTRGAKCSEEFTTKCRIFMESWTYNKNQKDTLIKLWDVVKLAPLNGAVKSHLLNMCEYFDTLGFFTLTEGL